MTETCLKGLTVEQTNQIIENNYLMIIFQLLLTSISVLDVMGSVQLKLELVIYLV